MAPRVCEIWPNVVLVGDAVSTGLPKFAWLNTSNASIRIIKLTLSAIRVVFCNETSVSEKPGPVIELRCMVPNPILGVRKLQPGVAVRQDVPTIYGMLKVTGSAF